MQLYAKHFPDPSLHLLYHAEKANQFQPNTK